MVRGSLTAKIRVVNMADECLFTDSEAVKTDEKSNRYYICIIGKIISRLFKLRGT